MKNAECQKNNSFTRARASAIIARWLATGDFPNRPGSAGTLYPGEMLADVCEHRAFLMELVYGIARWKGVRRPPLFFRAKGRSA